eukprot:CAMPEP_0119302834 /NCGR_PEP_ID=MMETSP1333-20130426/4365_1 /TAXON_ID=418940 /ORGANISM="Scyphosphaera apsteinii, Strain RCC1455" /LENGTH=301 /DNA_ID=CAMNT_0007305311 /DNA_START=183 /DNA_END=1088 /DNA_ORIENTATION=-
MTSAYEANFRTADGKLFYSPISPSAHQAQHLCRRSVIDSSARLAALIATVYGDIGSKVTGATAIAEMSPTQMPAVTARCFLDLRIIQRFDVEVLEDAAVRGRMVFGLFGVDAPAGVSRYMDFITGKIGQFREIGDGPSYRSSSFEQLQPGVIVEGGRITGLDQTQFAGTLEYEYRSRLVPLRPVLEVNGIRHERRGLLTRKTFNAGPEFAVTLGPAPSLDGMWEVIGQLEEGGELLDLIETLPYITGRSLEEPGSVADQVFKVQRSLFTSVSKSIGDTRAKDRTGQLLRRVEITNCGVLTL